MSQTVTREPSHPVDPLFTRRWSPRGFDGSPISEAELLTLFEAARWAPSAYNQQPWRFVFGRRDTPAWGPIFNGLIEFNQGWAKQAAALVVVLSRTHTVATADAPAKPIATHAFDAGAAWASLAFQAIHSGWYAHAMSGIHADVLRAGLAVPDSHAIHAVVAIGKRAAVPVLPEALQAREQPSPRRPLAEIVAEGRFTLAD